FLRLFASVFTFALNMPIVYLAMTGRLPRIASTGPTWYAAAVTLWQLGLVAAMPLVAGFRLLVLGAQALFKKESTAEVSPSRRAFLKTSFATAPAAILVS